MNPIIEALTLGIVQGVTEFLPVSSSAHLILVSWMFDGRSIPLTLNIALHLGTVSAVLLYFWRDWYALAVSCVDLIVKRQPSFHSTVLLPALLIGSVPAGIIGVLWEKDIEAIFHHPVMTLIPLAMVGILLWWGDAKAASTRELRQLTIKDGFVIGCAQALALIPGVSRSGATILCGRMLHFRREDAARFSFLLGTPAMAGAALLNADEIAQNLGQPIFYWGFFSAAIVGCVAIAFLLRFMQRFSLLSFAIYRVVLAVVMAIILYHQS